MTKGNYDSEVQGCLAELRTWAIHATNEQRDLLLNSIRSMADIIEGDMPSDAIEEDTTATADKALILNSIVLPWVVQVYGNREAVRPAHITKLINLILENY